MRENYKCNGSHRAGFVELHMACMVTMVMSGANLRRGQTFGIVSTTVSCWSWMQYSTSPLSYCPFFAITNYKFWDLGAIAESEEINEFWNKFIHHFTVMVNFPSLSTKPVTYHLFGVGTG